MNLFAPNSPMPSQDYRDSWSRFPSKQYSRAWESQNAKSGSWMPSLVPTIPKDTGYNALTAPDPSFFVGSPSAGHTSIH